MSSSSTPKTMIEFVNVTKKYSRYQGLLKVKNFLDRIKNYQIAGKLVQEEDFYALRDVSFKIREGERVAILGKNGAGKSTSLKLINKIIYPSSGKIKVNGSLAGVIELGAGFQPDLSGRENVYIGTALLGFSKAQADELMETILEISELHKFIDVPVKKYSSGMKVRLAFAMTMLSNPDIVLLDEVLAVGDAAFRKKSLNLMEQYLKNKTLVFVSHSMDQVKQVCNRAILINEGRMIFDGPVEESIKAYHELLNLSEHEKKHIILSRNVKRGFSEAPKAQIQNIELENSIENKFFIGDKIKFKLHIKRQVDSGSLSLKIRIKKPALDQLASTLCELPFKIPETGLPVDFVHSFVFDSEKLYPAKYLIEAELDCANHGEKAGLSIFECPLTLEKQSTPSVLPPTRGIVDLNLIPRELVEVKES